MATGIIESISVDSGGTKSGKIKLDETGDAVEFFDQAISCDVDDPVSFTLQIVKGQPSIAVGVQCIVGEVDHVLTPLKTAHVGDVTIGENEKLVVKNGGSISGTINVNGGKLKVAGGGDVKGQIIIAKSGSVVVAGGSVEGNINAEEAELLKINGGGDVKGQIIIAKGHKMVLDGGSIHGGLDIQAAYKIVVKSESKITGA
jgi:hypothetical protein